ncbi:MAG TPA: hypothetical protein VK914_01705 [bacterium]|nr:hypothetical protein [bacterium]
MLRTILLSLVLVAAPFLRADSISTENSPSIFVYSDYKGMVFIDGKKYDKIRSIYNGDHLEITDLQPGDYQLAQQINRDHKIYCDVRLDAGQDTYVYMRLDGAVLGHSLGELGYFPKRNYRKIVGIAFICLGALAAIAFVVVVAVGLNKCEGEVGGCV